MTNKHTIDKELTSFVSLRLSREEKHALAKAAVKNNRTIAGQARHYIQLGVANDK